MNCRIKLLSAIAIAVLISACGTAQPSIPLSQRAQADQFLYRSAILKMGYVNSGRPGLLIQQLILHQYPDLEADLAGLQADFDRDPAYEEGYRELVYDVGGCDKFDPALEDSLQAWVAARPQSAWSHLLLGMYYLSGACQASGDAEDLYISKSLPELKRAEQLNGKLPPIYWSLIILYKLQGDTATAKEALAEGYKNSPRSYYIAAQYMSLLNPGWLGSLDQMKQFAQQMLVHYDENPRFWFLQGYAESVMGDNDFNEHDYAAALSHYKSALVYGDYRDWLERAGYSEYELNNIGAALQYYRRLNRYDKRLSPDKIHYMDIWIETCKRTPGKCKTSPADFPWSGEPGPHDPTDDDPLSSNSIHG